MAPISLMGPKNRIFGKSLEILGFIWEGYEFFNHFYLRENL
jgi:hypothetical protein